MRYRFGGVELDTDTYELRAGDRSIDVEPQVFEVLTYLVAHRDRVVPKEELLDQIWGNRFVSESALTTRIKQARQAVGDDGRTQRVIRTVHGRGYRFVAPVDEPPTDSARRTSARPSLDPDVDLEPVPDTHYVSNDGAAIAYQVFGSGPDLVLIGGFVSNVEVQWEHPAIARFLRGLGSFCRVVVLDKRGTGVSERLSLGEVPPLEQRASDVRAVMDAVGLARATVLGSSEGGSLAIMLTAMHPERVDRLILHGTWARHPWMDQPDRPEFAWVERRWGSGRVLSSLAATMAATAAGRRFLARYERQSATPATARRLVETMSAIDVTPVLPSIAVPTLVVHREQDAAYGLPHAHALVAGIPGARLVTLPGIDHFLYSGDTAPLLSAIASFVTGTAAAPVPERFLATVLVAEVAGGEFDEAAARVARRPIEASRGEVVALTGAGLTATLDGPGRAVRAAAQVRASLAPLGIDVRIGIHVAEVERHGGTLAGLGVEVAGRLARAAEPGAVLVSRTVTDLVAGCGLAFTPYGDPIDGLPHPPYEAVL